MDECKLCKLINEREIIYSSPNIVIVESKIKTNTLHLIVLTKKHEKQSNILCLNLLNEIKEKINELFPSGWRIIINYGKISHQTEEHCHFHIIGGETLKNIGY